MLASNKLSGLGSSLKRIWSYFQLSADSFELSTDLFLLVSGKVYLCVLENTNRRSRKSIARIARISMRDEYFLIRGELHEYHPDGKIRGIDLRVLRFVL